MKKIIIKENDSNQRLDKFLFKYFKNYSRTLIFKLIRTKKIKVNNQKKQPNYILQVNDIIDLYIDSTIKKSQIVDASDLSLKPIDILYEDDNILLINKPVGLVVHEDNKNSKDTLINRTKSYLIKTKQYNPQIENSFVPSLCNRLDRNTQGIVIVAKNAQSLKILNEKIKHREIKKMYLALVHGKVKQKSQILTNFLFKNEKLNKVFISNIKKSDNVEIITKYKLIKYVNDCSLCEIELITGKTHQIRAHMSYIGHPIVGDTKYAINKYKNKTNKQYLCAYKINFDFKTDAGVLNYLKNKTFEVKNIWFLYNI